MGRMGFAAGSLALGALLGACSGAGLPEPANLCEQEGAQCVSVPVRDLLAVDGDTFELRRLSASGGEQRVRLRLIGWDFEGSEISPGD